MIDIIVLPVLLAYATAVHPEISASKFPGAPCYRRGGLQNCCGSTVRQGRGLSLIVLRIFARPSAE